MSSSGHPRRSACLARRSPAMRGGTQILHRVFPTHALPPTAARAAASAPCLQ